MQYSIMFTLIYLASLTTGYLMGHNQGYDLGHKIGLIDAKMKASGQCFLHNGKCE